jgi:hypothetical protein
VRSGRGASRSLSQWFVRIIAEVIISVHEGLFSAFAYLTASA